MLAVLKGLPLAYQRDLQEDKAPLFESVATYGAALGILAGLLEASPWTAARMRAAADEGFITATAVADELVRRGIPFRTAHHIVGRLVVEAEAAGSGLADLDDAAFNGAGGRRRAGGRCPRRRSGHARDPPGGRCCRGCPGFVRRHRRDGPRPCAAAIAAARQRLGE